MDGYNHWQRRAIFSKMNHGQKGASTSPLPVECSVCGGEGTLPIVEVTQGISEDGCGEVLVSGDVECFLCKGTGKETP